MTACRACVNPAHMGPVARTAPLGGTARGARSEADVRAVLAAPMAVPLADLARRYGSRREEADKRLARPGETGSVLADPAAHGPTVVGSFRFAGNP